MRAWRSAVTGLSILAAVGCGKVSDFADPPALGMGGMGGASSTGSAGAAGRASGGAGVGGGGGAGAGGSPAATCGPKASLAPARVWQLSDQQYVTVVRQVFGVSLADTEAPKVDAPARAGAYTNFSEQRQVDFNAAVAYERAAEIVATRATADLTTFLSCATADATCVEAYFRRTVPRAYRRPVTDAEIADLMELYRGAAATDGAAVGVGLVLQAILMSPFFLYRTEIGTNGATATAAVSLTPHELASALSFMFLESVPDDALWSVAQSGELAKASVLAAQVERLLALPAARKNLARKVSYWLGTEEPATEKSHVVFPVYTPSLAEDLDKSLKAFLDDVLWKGRLSDLFTSSRVYVNAQLSSVYGIMGGLDTTLVPIEVTAPERGAGLLTQPGMLMAMNRNEALGDVVYRGLFVYNSLVCGGDAGDLPPPPPDPLGIAATMTGTEREKVSKRAAMVCGGCHSVFDPLGLVFERYDAIGRYNATTQVVADPQEPGKFDWITSRTPIDTSAILSAKLGPDLAGPVADVGQLAAKLGAAKKRVAACAARRVGQYSVGHDPSGSCTIQLAGDVFLKSESFEDLFRALATLPGFTTREPVR